MNKLFVYGSLMNDEIQIALVGKTFRKSPAKLNGYIVSCLSDRHSPGLKKKADSTADGFVLHDVDASSFETIKAWENGDYDLVEVEPSEGAFGTCFTFLWKSDIENMTWDNESFRKNHLKWFLEVDIPKFKNNYHQ